MNKEQQPANLLIAESSPYLQQHAYNPVNWHPWSKKALEKAQKEQKPLIISIGYAACHWCHVMEKESFSDTEVADFMNENFVCIKVDREERPDIDHIYMNAAVLTSGQGGWPLNAFALPDGRPFFAATYFPKEKWLYALRYFAETYHKDNAKLKKAAQSLTDGVTKVDIFELDNANKQVLTKDEFRLAINRIISLADKNAGGLQKTPKFPLPGLFSFLLMDAIQTQNEESLNIVRLTLQKICSGGIFDHVAGGFARYSTDANWTVPHFEKMLYDNGLLLELCAQFCSKEANPIIKTAAKKTVYFLLEKCLTKDGLFISAIDADSEGEEGAFYTWQYEELRQIIGEDFATFATVFNILPQGNFEDKIILERKNTSEPTIDKNTTIEKCLQKLSKHRAQRLHPQIDDKSLTAWNAMAISGLLAYARYLQDATVGKTTIQTLDNLLQKQWDGKTLYRKYHHSKNSIPGFLDDYAFLCKTLIDGYNYTFDEKYLKLAYVMAKEMQQLFWNAKTQFFNYKSSQSEQLVTEPVEVTDNVIPSASAIACLVLQQLGVLFDNAAWQKVAQTVVLKINKTSIKNPAYHYTWLRICMQENNTPWQLVFTGKEAEKEAKKAAVEFLPNTMLFIAKAGTTIPLLKDKPQTGKLKIFPCQGKACQAPVSSLQDWKR